MKLQLLQPFINAADAVLAHALECRARVAEVAMDNCAYRKQGVAATVALRGEVEGRIILDLAPETAAKVGALMSGSDADFRQYAGQAVCELANQVIGNAVTVLNDQGYRFRVLPPQLAGAGETLACTHDTEALVMRFDTASGPVYLNIALRFIPESMAAD